MRPGSAGANNDGRRAKHGGRVFNPRLLLSVGAQRPLLLDARSFPPDPGAYTDPRPLVYLTLNAQNNEANESATDAPDHRASEGYSRP